MLHELRRHRVRWAVEPDSHRDHRPGFHTAAAFFSGEELEVEPPAHFFREEGLTPERVVLRLACHGGRGFQHGRPSADR